MRHHRFYGYGPGYCYYGQHRALIVIADSLETARAMAAPRARLRAERPYLDGRMAFVFALPL